MSLRHSQERRSSRWQIVFHLSAWLAIFMASHVLIFVMREANWDFFWRTNIITSLFCGVFYLNYNCLIKRYLERGKVQRFALSNLFALGAAVVIMAVLYEWMPLRFRDETRPYWPLMIKDSIIFIIIVLVSIAVHFSSQFHKADEARKEAELGRSEAELKNLRNQLNPHFLLNTLNNIYALIAFDSNRAQEAVLDLSTMLRYVLYENATEYTPISKEIAFLQKYIALMKIRLSKEVDVRMEVDVPNAEEVRIAPLILISLVENAFKHGISATQPSFIDIRLFRESDILTFICRNSNYPKSASDHSGCGIGLQQVVQRLRLSYPDAHEWHCGVDETTGSYTVILRLHWAAAVTHV
ncbi:MAG: histidine kinase [Bacteroidales bacterium]|nr:histidine kinase [Bacteroidales bacterium]